MKVLVLKIVCLFVLFCLTLLLSLIPVRLIATKRPSRCRELCIAFCGCFAGGVFLATCLLGLLPDVRNTLMDVSCVGGFGMDADYPNTELLVGTGFFLVLFIEQTIMSRKGARKKASRESRKVTISLTDMGRRQSCDAFRWPLVFSDGSENLLDGHDINYQPTGTCHSQTGFRSYILLVALSVHSLFEGLALGLEDNERHVLQLFYALIAHKSVLAFSLGVSLVMSNMVTSRLVKSCVLFSVVCPFGIGIGLIIMESATSYSSHLVAGLLQGLAAGTFLYVTCFEVMAPEFNKESNDYRIWKVLLVVIGFGLVALAHLFHSHPFGSLNGHKDWHLCVVNVTNEV